MTTQFLIALLINLALLLLISWIAAAYIITALIKEKKALQKQEAAQTKPNTAQNSQPAPDMSTLLEEMSKEISEKEAQIQSLITIDNNQQQARFMLSEFGNEDNNEALDLQLQQMDNNSQQTQELIESLQKDLEASQYALKSMEQQVNDGQGQAARIASLEKSQRRLRDENHRLRIDSSKHEQEAIHSKNLKAENNRLKRTIKSLSSASNEQLAVIRKLQKEIDRATQLEKYQQSLIQDMEEKLATENQQDNVDQEQVKAMEAELEELKDTLKRTLVEKQFIEDHLLEMDDSLEKAKETEKALEKAKEEIAQLEQKFPEYTPEQTDDDPQQAESSVSTPSQPPPIFESDNPELNAIVSDNRLYGALQEFWTSLDTPPLNLTKTSNINPPPFNDWVEVTIGDHEFQVIMAVNDDLAQIIANAVFDEPSDEEQEGEKKDAIGELCNIVAGTLATELDNNYPVSIPKHIDYTDAYAQQQEATLVSEILTLSQDKPLYAAMFIPPESKKSSKKSEAM